MSVCLSIGKNPCILEERLRRSSCCLELRVVSGVDPRNSVLDWRHLANTVERLSVVAMIGSATRVATRAGFVKELGG